MKIGYVIFKDLVSDLLDIHFLRFLMWTFSYTYDNFSVLLDTCSRAITQLSGEGADGKLIMGNPKLIFSHHRALTDKAEIDLLWIVIICFVYNIFDRYTCRSYEGVSTWVLWTICERKKQKITKECCPGILERMNYRKHFASGSPVVLIKFPSILSRRVTASLNQGPKNTMRRCATWPWFSNIMLSDHCFFGRHARAFATDGDDVIRSQGICARRTPNESFACVLYAIWTFIPWSRKSPGK